MIGQTISHYRIVEKLGVGGMGVVYKAEDTSLRRMVALKFLSNQDQEQRERFLREAQAVAAINHPNICTMYEIDEERGFLAIELVEGPSLKEKIAARPLKLDEALDFAIQTCQGLQAAHEKGVVHRDIKPSNLMLTAQGQVKIMDFGLAHVDARTRITRVGASFGTPAYMSPEQARGDPSDRRTDIWSLGVTLYEMLAGRPPFPGQSEAAVARAILDDVPEPLTALRAGLPVALDRIIAKALAKRPNERYQNVEDLQVDLRACRKASAGAAPPSRKARIAWIAAAAACAAGLAAGLWIGTSRQTWNNPFDGARYSRVTDFEGNEVYGAISPDGKLVTFVSDRDGPYDLWVTQVGTQNYVNLTQGKVTEFTDYNDRLVGFDHDASHIWFFKNGTGVLLIPAFGGPARPFLDGVVSAVWSLDGRRIVYHTWQPGDPLYVSDPDGTNAIEIFRHKAGVHCHYPAWSPDGRFVYFAAGYPPNQMDVWRIPAGGGNPERLTTHNSLVRYPAPLDDRTLVYTATADDGSGSCLYVMDLNDRISRRVTAGLEQYASVTAEGPAPGRSRRLVATLVNPSASLWTVPVTAGIANESAVKRLSTPNAQTQSPRAWADQILYLAASGPSHSLWRRESDGRASELWKSASGGLIAPAAASPDGKLICFSVRRKDRAAMYVMNADGTNPRMLSSSFNVRSAPSWSPDSKWIVASGDEGQESHTYKIPVAGGAPARLLDKESARPVWSPDGQMIVYVGPDIANNQAAGAMTPEGKPLPFPKLEVQRTMDSHRFLPSGRSMVILQGVPPQQNFWLLDLASGNLRQLTDLRPGFEIQSFDVTPDGKQIVFDRLRANADVVLIELSRSSPNK